MGKLEYSKIYGIKVFLGIVLLIIFLYMALGIYHTRKNSSVERQKILFVIDNSDIVRQGNQLDLSESKQAIFDVLDFLQAEEMLDACVFGLVSTAGSSELELPFVQDVYLFKQYVESIQIDENFAGSNVTALQNLLSTVDADKVIMVSRELEEDLRNIFAKKWFDTRKDTTLGLNLLIMVLLVLMI